LVPSAGWEQSFFPSIEARAAQAKLDDLKLTHLDGNDFEIRIWEGFGVSRLSGYVIKRKGTEWSALLLLGVDSSEPVQTIAVMPKSGWDPFWQHLTQSGILTLPDSSTLPDYGVGVDATSCVVETNMNLTYRTYMYSNPEHRKSREARQMVEIIRILDEELRP
jgi:hypothetical protein